MKTSNKILLGLVITVFAVPLLLAASLKNKMNKGEYTEVINDAPGNSGNTHKGTFTAFKVVKVIAPRPEMLVCNLHRSDKMDFSYSNDGTNDSLTVYTQNDTLYIAYLSQSGSGEQQEHNGYGKIVANINLPVFNRLMVDGAVVVMESTLVNSDSLTVSLKNNAVIQEGNSKERKNTPDTPAVKNENLSEKEITQVNLEGLEPEVGKLCGIKNAGIQMIDFSVKDVLINHLIKM